MRHFSHFLATLAITSILLTGLNACTIETSGNGDLDGFWHLERIDTLSTGGVNDMSGGRQFWAFEHRLLSLQGSGDWYYARFWQTADSVVIFSPYLDHGHQDREDGGDIPVTNPEMLAPYGIASLEEHFVKEHLSGSRMVLRSPTLRLYFRKF